MATATALDTDFGTSVVSSDSKKSGHRIQCVVVTPERTLFDELVDFVALPLFDGELGVLPGRAPVIGRLGYGELRTSSQGSIKRYYIDGGFAQVRDNVVTVLTNRAISSGALDPQLGIKELEQAKARPATSEFDRMEKDKAIARATAMIRVAGHSKGKP